jgi:hypothetical protein
MMTMLGAMALCCGATAAMAEVSATEEGLRVRSGRAGYTLGYPVFLEATGDKSFKPIEIKADGGSAQLRYQDGATVAVKVQASGEVELAPNGVPGTWKRYKMTSQLGYGVAEGGAFAIGGGASTPFPQAKPPKPMLHQGPAESLTVTTGEGDWVTFGFPQHSYLQLQDNREWGWKMFQFHILCVYHKDWGAIRLNLTSGRDEAVAAARPTVKVDELGQNALMDWPLKARAIEDMKGDVGTEEAYYAALAAGAPALDEIGGLPGSAERFGFQKTGFFHVEQKDGKWYLVNPAGNLFFHLGVCSFLPYQSATKVEGREEIYAWLPPRESEFATAWGDKHGSTRDQFNFHVANLIRKYGEPYNPTSYSGRFIRRVRSFGFNSGGAFGDPDKTARDTLRFPYTSSLPLSKWGAKMKELDRDVWDPFDEGNRANVVANFKRLADRANDPLLIGYFIANEPLYENLPAKIPTLDASWACKRALVDMLKAKYVTVEAFHAAWGLPDGPAFEEHYERGLPVKTAHAAADMRDYMALFHETLFKLVHDNLRLHDPNHMILGTRLQRGTFNNEQYCRILAKYTDVVSYNCYTYGIDRVFLTKVQGWLGGKPMILSEFYWDSPSDSGLPGGVKDIGSQKERGLAYRDYVETAATLGYVVGIQWYTLLDTHYTGVGFAGYGGWNANEGLFSVVDRPWKPMVELMAETNHDIYKVVLRERAAFAWDDPRFKVGGGGGSKVASAPRAPGAIVLDGRTEDWPGVPPESIGAERLVEGASDGGVEAVFRVCWDDAHLHVLVDVSDPTPMRNDHTGERAWDGDAVELFVGGEAPKQDGPLLASDRHVLLSAATATEVPRAFIRNAPADAPHESDLVAVVPRADGKGYVLETSIPWDLLDIKPGFDQSLLFDLAVDDGETGERRTRQLMWNGTSRNSNDRGGWGRLRLVQ